MTADTLGVLLDPDHAFRGVRGKGADRAVYVLLFAWLSVFLSVLLWLRAALSPVMFAFLFVMTGVMIVFLAFCKAVVFHVTASLAGGRGDFNGLFSLMAHSLAPFHLLLPVALLPPRLSSWIFPFSFIAAAAWTGALALKAIRKNYGLSQARALAVELAPALVFLMLVLVCAAAALVAIVVKIFSILAKFPMA